MSRRFGSRLLAQDIELAVNLQVALLLDCHHQQALARIGWVEERQVLKGVAAGWRDARHQPVQADLRTSAGLREEVNITTTPRRLIFFGVIVNLPSVGILVIIVLADKQSRATGDLINVRARHDPNGCGDAEVLLHLSANRVLPIVIANGIRSG